MKRILLASVFGVLSGAALIAWQQLETPIGNTLPAGALNAQESGHAVDTSNVVEMVMGPEDAKITVVEYASFTCPHCAHFHETSFKEMKRDFIDTGKIKFVYRDVYFDKFGLWASMLARCDGPNKFFGISGMIYDQQKEWVSGESEQEISDNLRKIGKVAGMPEDKIETCLNDTDKAKALIAWYQKNVETDGVSGTPTLIIDGKKYPNMPYDELKKVIEEKLGQ